VAQFPGVSSLAAAASVEWQFIQLDGGDMPQGPYAVLMTGDES
jgi:hypothetical protein